MRFKKRKPEPTSSVAEPLAPVTTFELGLGW
jgi:hypothetical protein